MLLYIEIVFDSTQSYFNVRCSLGEIILQYEFLSKFVHLNLLSFYILDTTQIQILSVARLVTYGTESVCFMFIIYKTPL